MILEGIVTTTAADGSCHAAAMGPHIREEDMQREHARLRRLTLKPFATSSTFANLVRHGEGVFHVTDNASLIADLVLSHQLRHLGKLRNPTVCKHFDPCPEPMELAVALIL